MKRYFYGSYFCVKKCFFSQRPIEGHFKNSSLHFQQFNSTNDLNFDPLGA